MNSIIYNQRMVETKIEDAIRENLSSVDLRYYKFNELPKRLLDVKNLRRLDLLETMIDVPEWLAQAETLEELYISETKATALIPVIHKLHNLRVLKMSYTELPDTLPDTFGQLDKLEELTLSGTDFTTFPPCLGTLKNLRSLSFKYCACAPGEVFTVLSRLTKLTRLRITFTSDYEENEEPGFDMPASVTRLSHLEVLDLHHFWDLRSLPDNIHELKNLKKVQLYQDIDDNGHIHHLPRSLFEIPGFERLDIWGCKHITALPSTVELWKTPKTFLAADTGITRFPSFLPQQMEHLEELSWSGPLPDLSACIHLKELHCVNAKVSVGYDQRVTGTEFAYHYVFPLLPELEKFSIFGGFLSDTECIMNFPQLKNLHLACNFEQLPEDIGWLQQLRKIEIFGARNMKKFPQSIVNLKNLQSLDINACSLAEVPRNMNGMAKLETLSLQNIIGMLSLPTGLYTLPQLHALRIECCIDLQSIPEGISQLTALKRLTLRGNKALCALPNDLGRMKNLCTLTCTRNNIQTLSDNFEGLTSLQRLCLEYNGKDSLPDSLFKLPSLEIFEYENKKMIHLPEEFSLFPVLKELTLFWCHNLQTIPPRLVQNLHWRGFPFMDAYLTASHTAWRIHPE